MRGHDIARQLVEMPALLSVTWPEDWGPTVGLSPPRKGDDVAFCEWFLREAKAVSGPLADLPRGHGLDCDRPIRGQCYRNAQRLIVYNPTDRVRYWEGLATTGGATFSHGWNTVDGAWVDRTWRQDRQANYLGLPIPNWFLRRLIARTGRWDKLLWAWWAYSTGRDAAFTRLARSDN